MGKSTAALLIGKRHEKAERRRLARIDDASFAPMVYAVVLPATTPRMLIQAFASWFGLPVPQRSTAQLATEHVVGVLRTLGTSLVIVDEVHNLTTNRQAGGSLPTRCPRPIHHHAMGPRMRDHRNCSIRHDRENWGIGDSISDPA
ncbi:hypothetical protein AHiyo4_24550 [Arthrobacter sp. Hiyo4]|nr:hypothetical protein AHiyo4_24550 [Arthrobacter sp. Hiyo4]